MALLAPRLQGNTASVSHYRPLPRARSDAELRPGARISRDLFRPVYEVALRVDFDAALRADGEWGEGSYLIRGCGLGRHGDSELRQDRGPGSNESEWRVDWRPAYLRDVCC